MSIKTVDETNIEALAEWLYYRKFPKWVYNWKEASDIEKQSCRGEATAISAFLRGSNDK